MPEKNKPRVLVVGYLPPPPEGTARITELIKGSDSLNNDFSLRFLLLAKSSSTKGRGKLSFSNVLANLWNIIRFIVINIVFRPAIIYQSMAQNTTGFLRDSAFIIASCLLGRRIVVHFHGGSFDRFYASRSRLFKWYIRFAISKIRRLIVLGERLKDQFKGLIARDRCSVIYNGLPPLNNIADRKAASDNHPFSVLFMGYLSRAKGAVDIVKTAALVTKKEQKGWIFHLCGEPVNIERNIVFITNPNGGYDDITRVIDENKLNDVVLLHGPVYDSEKAKMFSTADIFVLPSYSEACPIAILEAMAYGLPIITTPVGALPEMLKEGVNCMFVRENDPSDIADKLMSLRQDHSLRETMEKNNKALVRDRYTAEAFLTSQNNIWKDSLS